jgi:fibronectin type 3 domain-containing protein
MKKSVIAMVVAVLVVCGLIGTAFFRKQDPPKPHSVTLRWRPPTSGRGSPIVSYNVYRSTTPGGPYVRIASSVNAPPYDDSLVNGGRTYYYVVTSVDAAGRESRYSSEISAAIP